MFDHEIVADQAVFRGGTALHKLFFSSHRRYSEDIDLVQTDADPIGPLVNAIREALDPWLGVPSWKQNKGRFTLVYRFDTTFAPVSKMRLKIEINTREHFSILGVTRRAYSVENPWFKGRAELPIFHLDELLGTKMRALYQRRKGRDLYDLWLAIRSDEANEDRVVQCFLGYMANDALTVSRAEFEANLAKKLASDSFTQDMQLLIPASYAYSPSQAARVVQQQLISKLPGKAWKGPTA